MHIFSRRLRLCTVCLSWSED